MSNYVTHRYVRHWYVFVATWNQLWVTNI